MNPRPCACKASALASMLYPIPIYYFFLTNIYPTCKVQNYTRTFFKAYTVLNY